MARIKEQQIVLPTYRLDSNLVLLPGIIYNVTFSRFKAAALLYRFKEQVSSVSVIKNLLAEYDFDNSDNQAADDSEEVYSNPTVISRDAVKGIAEFYRGETNFTSGTQLDSSKELVTTKPQTEFDWLTLAIKPNLTKIKDPENSPVDPNETNNVVTVVRIVGIMDDVTNIKLTLQGITRASTVKDTKTNESLFEIDWREKVEDLRAKFALLRKNSYKLFKRIDDFIVAYRQALTANGSNANNANFTKKNLGRSKLKKDNGNLITLNPLANAFYLQLVGSKDFTKAFISLQNLYGQFSAEDPKHKIDNKSFLRLIDLTSGILPFPNNEKLRLLNKLQISERSDQINAMINQLITIFDNLSENNSFVNHWFYNEASNIQKANVVANQLKSIRLVLEGMTNKEGPKPLSKARLLNNDNKTLTRRPTSRIQDEEEDEDDDDGDDDLKAITDFIKNKLPNISGLSSDSKRLIVKDYKRIRSNSQPGGGGNSDFHVIRNYLEIVMDIPWDKFVTKFANNKDIDLKLAKDQLDNDHYGLSHVKRRLIQYLVVLKLLGLNAEKSIEKFKNDNNITDLQPKETQSPKTSLAPSSTSSSIVIANNDETSNSLKQARNKVKTSISETNLEQETNESIQISKNNKSPIIMLTGPPGTGKTSLAKSIAKSLGRNFQRISLGGIKDESEIRGHRRTYIGSMPGLIVQALRKSRSMNPVILLDEIDKVVGGNSGGNKFNGDPSAALLEVLDPEQNNSFIDHYLGFPIDLSQVIFVCTSNEPHLMSRPLLDRLEMIEVGAYDYNEKLIIGKKYLLPRQIKRNGFPSTDNQSEFININPATFKKIIVDYTREAGVRNLERRLATICRFKAVEYCETLGTDKSYNPTIDIDDLSRYLGVPYSSGDLSSNDTTISSSSRVGIVNGLSYNSEGSGSVLVFESIGFDKRVGNPNSTNTGCSLTMTGRLGEVLSESGKIGLIYIKSLIYKNLLSTKDKDERYLIDKFNNLEINLHVPMGSISKDGPSAGVTMALSFLSVLLDKPVPGDIAMTGEITLRGLVLPIGGVKEKMMGAHLNGTIKRMIVPRENRKDLIEEYSRRVEEEGTLDTSLVNELLKDNENTDFKLHQVEEYFLDKYGIQFFYAKEFSDVMRIVWGDEGALVNLEYQRMVEYHL